MPIKRISGKLFINPAYLVYMLGLFFTAITVRAISAPQKQERVARTMTVLTVNPPNNNDAYFSVIFQISQRVYKLPKNANPRYLRLLKGSARNHTPVLVWRANEGSDVILSIEKPK